ncbi:MAG TPA: HDOD domain-containing protein [Anaerolineae bacterium]|nr:HDOD domain-containing protein [Anaerolineae bacterium]
MKNTVIDKEAVNKALSSRKLHPSVPEIIVEIINLTRSPYTTIHDFVKVIEKDPELASRILQIANSGFYSFKRKINSISHAVTLMGWNTIKMISLGSTILKRMSECDKRLYSHSLRTAHIARFLAVEADFYKIEEIAIVGLLHDLGSIILEEYFHVLFLKTRQYALDHGVPTYIAERELLGIDHADVGGWTLEEWKLPENIIESVVRHHSFEQDTYHARKTAVIHVADILAFAVDYGGPSWEKVSEMSPSAVTILGFSDIELKDMILSIMKMKLPPLIL